MIFVFDLDDTVCDTDSYSEEYILNYFKENNLPYKKITSIARFAEKKFDWDMDTALNWYKQNGDEMMLNFPCKEGAVELINELYDLGHIIIIATARANDWHREPESITKEWLKKVGLKYNKLYIGRIDKEKICEETNADFFIDDDVNITGKVGEYFASINVKKKSFIMSSEYNKTLKEDNMVIRVDSFIEFKNKLKELRAY